PLHRALDVEAVGVHARAADAQVDGAAFRSDQHAGRRTVGRHGAGGLGGVGDAVLVLVGVLVVQVGGRRVDDDPALHVAAHPDRRAADQQVVGVELGNI